MAGMKAGFWLAQRLEAGNMEALAGFEAVEASSLSCLGLSI